MKITITLGATLFLLMACVNPDASDCFFGFVDTGMQSDCVFEPVN